MPFAAVNGQRIATTTAVVAAPPWSLVTGS